MTKEITLSRRAMTASLASLALAGVRPLGAQQVPNTRIIVPFPAGGIVDALARIIADKLGPRIRDQPIILNQPGANGLIAASALKAAAPDGKTLMIAPLGIPVLNPLVMAKPGPVFGTDYQPLSLVARYSFAIAVAADVPVKTVPELIAWLKANPARRAFGITGAGNLGHFLGFSLGKAWSIDWTPVVYKGAPPMKLDMIGGRLGTAISGDAEFLAEHRAGSLRVIATTGRARSKLFPDLPTLRELGYEQEAAGWYGMFVPAGTPAGVVKELNIHLREVLALPDVVTRFVDLGFDAAASSPEDLAALIKSDIALWQPIIKASGFTNSN